MQELAVGHGHVHCLEYFRDVGIDFKVCAYAAARRGRLNCLKKLRDFGYDFRDGYIFGVAFEHEQFDCAKFLCEVGAHVVPLYVAYRPCKIQLEILKYLYEKQSGTKVKF